MRDGCASAGKPMLALDERECRWPVSRDGGHALFCAAEIPAQEWATGAVGSRYCRQHRLRNHSRGTVAEQMATKMPVTRAA